MALRNRRGGRARNNVAQTRSRRSTRQSEQSHGSRANNGVPDVYHGMLQEVASSPTASLLSEEDRPLKRRRVARKVGTSSPGSTVDSQNELNKQARRTGVPPMDVQKRDTATTGARSAQANVQTIMEESDDSDDTDLEWEDVDIYHSELIGSDHENSPEIQDISIVLDGQNKAPEKRKQPSRKGITAAERRKRQDVHKMHFLCLLYHVHLRNAWCNDRQAQETLKNLMPAKITTQLLPDPDYPQLRVAQSISAGLKAVTTFWQETFRVNNHGLFQPRWDNTERQEKPFKLPEHSDPPMNRDDFRSAAVYLNGSQDTGAQLFCAMLRSIGVEARLVCSLQCLPFTATLPPITSPNTDKKTMYLDSTSNLISENQDVTPVSASLGPTENSSHPKRISRLGRSGTSSRSAFDKGKAPKMTALPRAKPVIKPHYPVYWVEVFNTAHQKWMSVDPLATFTIDRPTKLEPPLSFASNSLSYAIAFEENATARDVTRRYAKAYNAKTRKTRIEHIEGGAKWLRKALRVFRRQRVLDRDQLEDAALARQEATEGLPKNIQDFKDHPIYLLERHLRRNEVLHPRHEVGRVTVGTSASKKAETVYRRKDVHTVRSADNWYRLGREVKPGEQPLKHHVRRNPRVGSVDGADDTGDDTAAHVGLYAVFQTELYLPPPVVRGRIPKNAYGNLDIYVPSMVPSGGIHLRHPDASKAARLLAIDYADAVTGFSFKGRIGTAVVQGCVVAGEYKDAVEAVLDGMVYQQEEDEMSMRIAEALRLWRRFFTGLKIVERVKGYASEDEEINVQAELDKEELQQAVKDALVAREADEDEGGGFFTNDTPSFDPPYSEANRYEGHSVLSNRSSDPADLNFNPRDDNYPRPKNDSDEGGGFMLDDSDGGGFMPEDPQVGTSPSSLPVGSTYHVDENVATDMATGVVAEDTTSPPATGDYCDQDDTMVKDAMSRASLSPGSIKKDAPRLEDAVDKTVRERTSMFGTAEPSNQLISTASNSSQPPTDHVERNGAASPLEVQGAMDTSEQVTPTNKAPDSESEHGSLLSHDPEDEDAEPEWLY